jgi:hypothetical protein
MFTRILLGLGIIVVGYLMALKTNWFLDILGPVEWAERHIVGGGTRTFYKLLGMLIIIIGIIVVTDLYDEIIGGLVRSIF